jgi:TetR/AcrR family transcriptional regulator
VGSQRRKSAGRPAGNDGERVKALLLDAARRHFLQREFKAVSVREIAESAGVNGAMVNYYFGSKQGLYMAMVDALLDSLQGSLAELGGDEELSVTEFSRVYTQVLLENPWWPNFLLREVLMKEGESRDAMVARFAGAFAPRLMASISLRIRDGQYRDDLDPGLTMLSMIALTVFPFLARPIVETVLGRDIDSTAAAKLVEHNIALFHSGVLHAWANKEGDEHEN